MPLPKENPDEKYSYADYLSWPDEERWELIDGVPYNMSPAPNTKHQEVSMEIGSSLHSFLKDKACKVIAAPIDVSFKDEIHALDEETYTVVQPDLVVVCDKDKIQEKGIIGPPDICIEILSESTSYKDEGEKYKLYEKHGVKEYWIINPEVECIFVYRLNGSKFEKPLYFKKDEMLVSAVLSGFEMPLATVFPSE